MMQALAEGLATAHEVVIAYGGPPVPWQLENVTLVTMPVLSDNPADRSNVTSPYYSLDYVRQQRRAILLDLCRKFIPDFLIIEHFPFGRLAFRDEIMALISEAGTHGTHIIASFRGIVGRALSTENLEQLDRDLERFDAVLVHTDEKVTALSDELDIPARHRHKFVYTGYLQRRREDVPADRAGTVVMCGSGRGSGRIIAAVAASAGSLPQPIDVYTGQYPPAEPLSDNEHLRIHPYDPDAARRLTGASLIISTAGYNSSLEAVANKTATVLISLSDEQARMADNLARLGLATHVPLGALDAETLLAAVDARPLRAYEPDMRSAETVAQYLKGLPTSGLVTSGNYCDTTAQLDRGRHSVTLDHYDHTYY
jgi:predicted glycosyltransferase